jgi:hypothetical protein
MSNGLLMENLALGIRELLRSGVPDAEHAIEGYLDRELRGVSMAERVPLVEELVREFSGLEPEGGQDLHLEATEAARLLSLFLGEGGAAAHLSAAEVSEKLALSLNTVFDSLNQIIGVIQSTLLGREAEIETIRHVIGSQIGGNGEELSLQKYLDQIQQAFLTAHQGFQVAARSTVEELLGALNPDALARETNTGLRFGPLRKAELFESYQEKYQECRRWFDSGRFTENLLREFEKYCQKTYQERT